MRSAPGPDTPVFSLGSFGSAKLEKQIGTQFTLRRGPWRYIRNSIDGSEELYDHRGDPGETRNVARQERKTLEELSGALRTVLAQRPRAAAPVEMTAEQAEGLRALGYVR